ncbi:MAG: TlpA family protein disulfide reductase [Acidobacteria bacterium]|nr:TlpA family protein disulfide reductase [Acidobacteriota bacterium]
MKLFTALFIVLSFSIIGFAQQEVGSSAQNFTQANMQGEDVELAGLKGKVVIMTFWSTKCEICESEIPKLNKLVDKYKGQDVVFLGLTMNHQPMVENYLKKKTFKFMILPNSFGVVLKYADRDKGGRLNMGYPAHFVIDQAGEVVLKTAGFKKSEKLDDVIGNLLGSGRSGL